MRKFFHKLLGIKPKLVCAGHITVYQQIPRAEWDKRAAESHEAGVRQSQCAECRVWFWPWERTDIDG